MMGISPQITNLVVVLVMMQVSKKIDFNDPTILVAVRAAYLISNAIIFAVYFYCGMVIDKKKDLTTLKYVEPAPMGSTEEPKLVTTTVQAYDKTQLKSAYKAQLIGVGMMCFMHGYLKYTNPLLIQSIIPLKGVFDNNLVKIHLLGSPASGELKRPFKAAPGIMGALGGQGEVQSDRKSVEAAEKKGSGGVKDE